MTRASVGGHMTRGLPPAKWAKDNDDLLPHTPADYNIDQWPSSPSEEGPPPVSCKGKGKAGNSPPPNVDDTSHPTTTLLPKKVAKP